MIYIYGIMIKVWDQSIVDGLVNEMYLMIATDDRSPFFPCWKVRDWPAISVDREAPETSHTGGRTYSVVPPPQF